MKITANALIKSALKSYKTNKNLSDLLTGKIIPLNLEEIVIDQEILIKKDISTRTKKAYIFESENFKVIAEKDSETTSKIEFQSKLNESQENLGKTKRIITRIKSRIEVEVYFFNKVIKEKSIDYFPFILDLKRNFEDNARFFSGSFYQFEDEDYKVKDRDILQEEIAINYKLNTLDKIANFNLSKFIEHKFVMEDNMFEITDLNKQNVSDLKMDFYKKYTDFNEYINNFCLYNKDSALDSFNTIKEISKYVKNEVVDNINKNIMDLSIFDNIIFDEKTKVSLSLENRHTPVLYIETPKEKFIVEGNSELYTIKAKNRKNFQINLEAEEIIIAEGKLKVFLSKKEKHITINNIILNNHDFSSGIATAKNENIKFEDYMKTLNPKSYQQEEMYLKVLDFVIAHNHLSLVDLLDSNFILDDVQKDLILLSMDYNLNENKDFKILEENFLQSINVSSKEGVKNIFNKKF